MISLAKKNNGYRYLKSLFSNLLRDERINQLEETLKDFTSMHRTQGEKESSAIVDEEYPGDEGDWLVWREIGC